MGSKILSKPWERWGKGRGLSWAERALVPGADRRGAEHRHQQAGAAERLLHGRDRADFEEWNRLHDPDREETEEVEAADFLGGEGEWLE